MKITPQKQIHVGFPAAIIVGVAFFCLQAQPTGPYGPRKTTYQPPADAYYAAPSQNDDPTNKPPFGNDNNSGHTPNQPWTITKTLIQAPKSATIVLRGGIYRFGEIRINKNFTIQPYQNETPICKGSAIVTDWTRDGNFWKTSWKHFFPNLNPGGEWSDDLPRDMVWIDDKFQHPVPHRDSITPGDFYIDYTDSTIFISTDPAGKKVEVTRYAYSIERLWWSMAGVPHGAEKEGFTLRGITFSHYARWGFWVRADSCLLEDNWFVNNSYRGILTYREGHVFRHNEVADNYFQGGHMHARLFENNIIRRNGILAKTGSRYGIKFGSVDGITICNNLAEYNNGPAIYFDVGARGNVVANNLFRDNDDTAIHFEISDSAVFIGNVFVRNRYGIWITISSHGRVYNNTFVDNVENIHVREWQRTDADIKKVHAELGRNYLASMNTHIVNNIFSNATIDGWPSAMTTVRTNQCGDWQLVTEMHHNAHYRTDPSMPQYLLRWDNRPGEGTNGTTCKGQKQQTFKTLQDFRTAEPDFSEGSLEFSGQENPFFIDPAQGNFRLKSQSQAVNAGVALTQELASYVGWPANKKLNMGAFQGFSPSVLKINRPFGPISDLISLSQQSSGVLYAHINSNQKWMLELFDIYGRRIEKISGQSRRKLLFPSSNASGILIYRLHTQGHIYSQSVTVRK